MTTDSDRPSDTEEEEQHSSDASESGDDAGGLLDLEAEESDGASDESDLSSDSSSAWQRPGPQSLPQFMRFPPEIRQQVWRFFAPDLDGNGRVLEFQVVRVGSEAVLWEGPALSSQLAPINTLLAINRESRALALRKFPDTLPFHPDDGGLVRYSKEADVVFMNILEEGRRFASLGNLGGFFHDIRNLALDSMSYLGERGSDIFLARLKCVLPITPNLKTLYECRAGYAGRKYRWCVGDSINRYDYQHPEVTPYGGEVTVPDVYTWPELSRNYDFAVHEIPVHKILDPKLLRYRKPNPAGQSGTQQPDGDQDPREDDIDMSGIEIWPIVRFFGQGGAEDLHMLWYAVHGGSPRSKSKSESGSTSESESESEPDEYESEGIDDRDIEDITSDDDEDDLVVVPISDSDSHGAEHALMTNVHVTDLETFGEHHEANFSSAQESATAQGASDSDADSDDAPLKRPKQTRRRVVESESEDESGAEETSPAPQPARRRARVVLSDSDADEGTSIQDNDAGSVPDHGYDSDEEEDESDDEPIRPLSLAERLRLHREENPISSPSHSGSDMGSGDGSGGGGDYADWNDSGGSENEDDNDRDSEGAQFRYEEEDREEYE